ncbi:MAG: YaaR family protein [bacterium]|nr:YaaR family protein [bacterium]
MINVNMPVEAMVDKNLLSPDSQKIDQVRIKEKSFDEELKTATRDQLKVYFEDLLSHIESQGKILVQSPIYDNLIQYKDLVKTFMEKVVRNLYSLEENVTATRAAQLQIGQRKVYTLIKEINQNLAQLTEEVVKGQGNPIDIAAKVEMIQGLLMDIYS